MKLHLNVIFPNVTEIMKRRAGPTSNGFLDASDSDEDFVKDTNEPFVRQAKAKQTNIVIAKKSKARTSKSVKKVVPILPMDDVAHFSEAITFKNPTLRTRFAESPVICIRTAHSPQYPLNPPI